MKEFFAMVFLLLGIAGAWISGLGATVTLICFILSLLGITFVQGAGTLFLIFCSTWVISYFMIGFTYMTVERME